MGDKSRGPADAMSCHRRWLRFCTWQVPSTQPARRNGALGLWGPKCRRGPFRTGRSMAVARLALRCGWRARRGFQTTGQGAGSWGCRPLEGVLAGGSLQKGMEEVNEMTQPFRDPHAYPLSAWSTARSLWSSGLGSWLLSHLRILGHMSHSPAPAWAKGTPDLCGSLLPLLFPWSWGRGRWAGLGTTPASHSLGWGRSA